MVNELPKINGLTEDLADIRRAIEDLKISALAYAAIGITPDRYIISVVDGDDAIIINRRIRIDDYPKEIVAEMGKIAAGHNIKIVAAAVIGAKEERDLGSRLWLEEDIVSYFRTVPQVDETVVREEAMIGGRGFDEHGLVNVPVAVPVAVLNLKVGIAQLVTKAEWKKATNRESWGQLEKWAEKFRQRKMPLVFVNATAQGGGVALMRHALMRLYQEIGVEASWHVMIPNSDVFEITKTKFHNVLQGVAPADTVLSESDRYIYSAWIQENARLLEPVFRKTNCIVIDDPQPSGLIPFIKQINPQAKIIYRSHIHLDRDLLAKKGSPQEGTWQFLWQSIKLADLFVAHPVEPFVPREAAGMTVTMPATTDPLDGLNKPLSDTQMVYYQKLFNKILLEYAQSPLDDERPYLVQIARFDPSKGIPDVIESYRLLRQKMAGKSNAPQLVLAGHGSVDDPDGVPIYNMTLHLLMDKRYRELAKDIKVVRLHHNDQVLNALLRGCRVALQLSHKEGYEIKVSEALHKGKPVVAFRAGGIPLQIEDGRTGFLVEVGDCEGVADKLFKLLVDDNFYQAMGEAARSVNERNFTVANAAKWLYLVESLLAGTLPAGRGQRVEEMMRG